MFTKSVISLLLAGFAGFGISAANAQTLRENVLRQAALDAGFVRAAQTHIHVSSDLVAAGKLVFQTKKLSLENEIACASCHLDRFGSADGLPNAVGTRGRGEGVERLMNGGDIIPRNALPFWGRGGKGFDVFFWDGRVELRDGAVASQFQDQPPSSDPLSVAVHLPPVEIGEMILDNAQNVDLQNENVDEAQKLYELLADRLRNDPEIGASLSKAHAIDREKIQFTHISQALAAFIRHNFRLKTTKFHKFVFDGGELSDDELEGGLIFYGKGRCSACHNGPYFSDFDFHSIPFPQAGFGRNGFGVDYGRYNVTLDVADLFKFRTPPLYNVTKTAPYSHSGSIYDLTTAIKIHVDPLGPSSTVPSDSRKRSDFYQVIKIWSNSPLSGIHLSDKDLGNLSAFLSSLEFESDAPVKVDD